MLQTLYRCRHLYLLVAPSCRAQNWQLQRTWKPAATSRKGGPAIQVASCRKSQSVGRRWHARAFARARTCLKDWLSSSQESVSSSCPATNTPHTHSIGYAPAGEFASRHRIVHMPTPVDYIVAAAPAPQPYHSLASLRPYHQGDREPPQATIDGALQLLRKKKLNGSLNGSRPSTAGSRPSTASSRPSTSSGTSSSHTSSAIRTPSSQQRLGSRGPTLLWSGSRQRAKVGHSPAGGGAEVLNLHQTEECLRTAACRCEACMVGYRALDASPSLCRSTRR